MKLQVQSIECCMTPEDQVTAGSLHHPQRFMGQGVFHLAEVMRLSEDS